MDDADSCRPAKILVINGSLGGARGNTARLTKEFGRHLKVEVFHLADGPAPTKDELASAAGFIFTTGVYWDSWGSPLQKFFENVTPLEGDQCWFGKPAALVVTMHSVGGKEVLSRLQGVLNSFGLFVPPMAAMSYSLANQLAVQANNGPGFADDFWCRDDLKVLAKNLNEAIRWSRSADWASWPVDREDPRRLWITEKD